MSVVGQTQTSPDRLSMSRSAAGSRQYGSSGPLNANDRHCAIRELSGLRFVCGHPCFVAMGEKRNDEAV
jgi:hypothetical protein